MKTAFPIALGLLLSCGSVAHAAEDVYSPRYSACMAKAAATATMVGCIAEETKKQDARLNRAYKALGAQLPPARKKQLLTAQRLWVQYRDANCDFYADPDGGTIARVNANTCVLQTTASRARELEGFIAPSG